MHDNVSNDDSADDAMLCLTTRFFESNNANTSQKPETTVNCPVDRIITADRLLAEVCENNILSPEQQEELYGVLLKYQQHLTKRLVRCNVFEYEFKIEGDTPTSANCRPIHFTLRAPVREQIQAMLREGILGESYSAYVNTLNTRALQTETYQLLLECEKNKQADGNGSLQGQAMRPFHSDYMVFSVNLGMYLF